MVKTFQIELTRMGRCPVCRSAERRSLFAIRDSSVSVYECRECRLRYIDPCLSPESMKRAYESEESLKRFHGCHDGYYDYGDLETESKTLSDFRHALVLLEKHISAATSVRTIFDVGFGNGLFLAQARNRGWRVNGIDSSSKNLELARNKFSLELACADFDSYDAQGMTYDAVSFCDVIEHFSDPHSVLKKACRMLKPDGFILIGIPNDRSMLRFLSTSLYKISLGRLKKGIEKTYFLEHVAYYNPKTIKELLKRHGFALRDYFLTSTDLRKYSLPAADKLLARIILLMGKITGFQNRWVGIFQRAPGL